MEREDAKRNGEIIIKIKKVISAIMSLIGILACSGVVYAAVTGRIKIGNQIFSDQYIEYEQKQENQYLEKDGTKVELVSTMCDDGFLVLQFEVEFGQSLLELIDAELEEYSLECLSFNDKIIEEDGYRYLYLNGANYNLIIDGEKYWLKGAVDSEIIENVPNKNYTVYQLYFLPSDIVKNEEIFTITLGDVVVPICSDEGKFIEMDGKFEIEISKQKAMQNTTTMTNNGSSIEYKRLTNKIEKVSQTPMQTIIKVSSLFKDATARNTTYLLDEDYIGTISYKIFDQNNNELFVYSSATEYEYYYEDGTVKTISISEIGKGEEDFEYNKYIKEEYIVTEKNEEIESLRVEIYEVNEYYGRTRNIGTHYINLEKEQITSENKNEIIEEKVNSSINDDTENKISLKDIEYFNVEINENYDYEINYHYANYNINVLDDGTQVYQLNKEALQEECTMLIYDVSIWNPRYTNDSFTIVLFKDKTLYDIYCREEHIIDIPLEKIEIEENSEYKIAVFMNYGVGRIENIKDIIDTIKLK